MKIDQTRLQQARQQYEQIPVPPQLHAKLEQVIAQHPYQKPAAPKRPFYRSISTIAAACLVAFLTILNVNPSIAQAVEHIPLLGTITRVCTVQTWFSQTDNNTISVNQPAVDGSSALSQSINAQIEQFVAQHTAEAQQRLDEYKEAFLATGGTMEEWQQHDLQVNIDYNITCQNDQYLSFVITSIDNWSNAYTDHYYYNIDLQTNHQITLQDILGDDYIAIANASIQQQMQKRTAADDTLSYFTADQGGFSTIDAATAFYINQAGNPVIVFEPYTIAPGFMGQQEFEITSK